MPSKELGVDNLLLRTQEAAQFLSVSCSTIYRLVQRNELPHIRKSFGLRFRPQDLEKWINQSRQGVSLSNRIISQALTFSPPGYKKDSGGGELPKGKTKTRLVYNNGAIFKRKTKSGKVRFYCEFYDEYNNRKRKVIKNAACWEEAKIALDDEVSRASQRSSGTGRNDKIKFMQFALEIYLEKYAKVRKRSWRSDQRYLECKLLPHFGDIELVKINREHVQDFISGRLKDGVKKSSINRELQVMRRIMSLAIDDYDYPIRKNPVKQSDLFNEEEYRRTRILSEEEEYRLMREAAPHLKAIIEFALQTGCRLQEILKLKIIDLDFENDYIIVRAENNKTCKTDLIPMNLQLKELLLDLVKTNKGRSEFVFNYYDPYKDELRPISTIQRSFTSACRRAGIKGLQWRDLRRSYSTRLHQMGIDPLIIQRLLRHSSFKTSEQVYIQSNMKQMKEAVNLLDERIRIKPENDEDLSRIWPTKLKSRSDILVNGLFSVN